MNTKKILLVEDNPDDVQLTLRALKMNHIANEVAIARDGVQALKMLGLPITAAEAAAPEQASDPGSEPLNPAVILLDLKLPKIDGLEVLQRLRNDPRTRLLPVVILTSSSEETDIVRGYSLGANSYVRKPVDFMQFADAVKQLGLFWLVLNEVPRTAPGS